MKPQTGELCIVLKDQKDSKGEMVLPKDSIVKCVGLIDLPDGSCLASLHTGKGHTVITAVESVEYYEEEVDSSEP